MSKTEQVKKLVKENKIKEALGIAKTFKIGLTKEQQSIIKRAYECILYPSFYESIGKNIKECIEEGINILQNNVVRG